MQDYVIELHATWTRGLPKVRETSLNIIYMKFADIPKFPHSFYRINVDLDHVERALEHWDEPASGSPLILNPEWQRGHVWTKKQQTSYMEYMLKGGNTGKEIYFNCSSWGGGFNTPIYCVDGLQRLSAALAFIRNEIPAFGFLCKDYEDRLRMSGVGFFFNMLQVKSKKELLNIYIDFNSGGTPHKPKEIARIIELQKNTDPSETV